MLSIRSTARVQDDTPPSAHQFLVGDVVSLRSKIDSEELTGTVRETTNQTDGLLRVQVRLGDEIFFDLWPALRCRRVSDDRRRNNPTLTKSPRPKRTYQL